MLRILWMLPMGFAAFATLLAWAELRVLLHWERAEGVVVRVHAFEGTGPFDRGQPQYAPVLRYVWTDGAPTEASVGMRHPDWKFAPGSRHEIRYHPGYRGDISLPGLHNWVVPAVLAGIALGLALPLGLIRALARRGQRRGGGDMGENPPG